MTRRKQERCKRALERRRKDVIRWRKESEASITDGQRDAADRKLFIASTDVARLESRVAP